MMQIQDEVKTAQSFKFVWQGREAVIYAQSEEYALYKFLLMFHLNLIPRRGVCCRIAAIVWDENGKQSAITIY